MRKLVAPATATLLASLACGGAPLEGSAAPTQSGAPPSVDAPGVLSAYTALKDTGCDPIAAGIDSPIVARVLRNAPFAQAGRTFSSPELTALYAADGGWYHPAGEGRSLSASDAACVAKLKRHEERLRRVVCVDPQSEAVITGHRDAWLWHHETGMTRMFGADPSAKRVIPADPGFDACAGERLPTQGEWTVARYTFALEVVATPAAAKAALSNADYGGMAPCFGNLTEAGARERFEAALSGWFRAGPVRHLRAVARIEDHLGGDEEWFEGLDDLSCVGPGPVMDRRWVCSGIALP